MKLCNTDTSEIPGRHLGELRLGRSDDVWPARSPHPTGRPADALDRRTAVPVEPDHRTVLPPRVAQPTDRRPLVRLTGALYLALAMVGPIGVLGVQSGTAGPATIAAWFGIVALDAAISCLLYVLLSPVSRPAASMSSALRLVYTAVVAVQFPLLFDGSPAALGRFTDAFLVGLVFFGVHLAVMGPLLLRAGIVPAFFGWALLAGGVGYVVDSIGKLTVDGYGGVWSALTVTPAMVGEVGLALWLVVRRRTVAV
jgi:hypothetical protein